MDSGFDVGEYYYRSCNNEGVFTQFKCSCPNSEHYSNCVVTLPTHYKIDVIYIKKFCECIKRFRAINLDSLI